MFIFSVKAQNVKLALSLIASVLIIVCVATLLPMGTRDYQYPDEMVSAAKSLSPSDFKNISANEDRVAFLKEFGWEVDPNAVEIIEVTIPREFDKVYQKYNALQISEGLNLEKYKGKSVKRYTYLVNNYDYNGSVYANLIIYKDRVIGGDICSAKKDGFVHGLTKGNDFLT